MKRFITYFIQYPVSGDVLLVLLILFGVISLQRLQSTFFPEAPSRAINIQVAYPGAGPEEVEEGVVLKIEDELKGTSGVERVTSTSRENTATIVVETKQGADVDLVLTDVKNAVDRIPSYPAGMEPLVVYKVESQTLAMSVALHAETDLIALKEAARRVERDLLSIDGISKITLSGFPDEEIAVNLRENDLRAYDLSFQDVLDRVRSANLEITGGAVKGQTEEWLIRYDGKGYQADALRGIVVKATADGRLVRLDDVADVVDTWAENPARNAYNGTPAVTVDVYNTNEEDILFITDTVRAYVEAFNGQSNVIRADIITDSSVNLRQRIDTLKSNGAQGIVLVLVLLALFLHIRLAFWVALSIPVAFAGMFILAGFFGVTINVISLFGMILVIGILVDDGIVISENIYRHYEEGKPRMRAAIDGTMEVLPAVLSAILTTMVAFSSFFFIEGRLGDFFSEMAFIVIATLLFSLVEGALILPAHVAHSKALDRDHQRNNRLLEASNRFMCWMRDRLYAPVLRFFLDHRALAASIPVALLLISLGAIKGGLVKTTFFPFIERTEVNVGLTMPSGTRADVTQRWLDHLEEAAWRANASLKAQRDDDKDVILAVDKRLGAGGSHTGSLVVLLSDMEERKPYDQGVLTITQALRREAGPMPAAEQVTFGAASAFGKPVSVALRGNDLEQVRAAAEELKRELSDLAELKDVTDNDQEGQREIRLKLNDRAFALGLTPAAILAQVRAGFFGGEVQRLQRGLDEVKVWVRYEPEDRATLDQLADMRVRTPDGRSYPLDELASFTIERGVMAINHTDGQREILVEADVASAKTSVTDLIANIGAEVLPPILARHPGVRYGFEGQVREQAKSARSMQTVMPVVLLLMLAIIVLTFRSFLQTLAVLLLIPFAYIGVVWGHFLHDKPISLFSILGIIALVGILVNDSLVFVGAFNNHLKSGKPLRQALEQAGLDRFRPIVLTSLTTIAGLAPLMLNQSFQAQFLIPMAVAVAYGLFVSTAAILVLLPVLLSSFNSLKRFAQWFWYDKRVSAEAVEPAVQELEWQPEMAPAIPESGGKGVDAGVVGAVGWLAPALGLLAALALAASPSPVRAQASGEGPVPTDTLTLDEALSEALAANLGLRQARLGRDVAETMAHPGMAGLLPSVAAGGSFAYGNVNTRLEFADPSVPPIEANGAATRTTNANVGLSYSLQGSRPFRQYERLKAEALAAGAQTELAVDNLAARTVAAYYGVVLARQQLDAARETVAVSAERLARARVRQEGGTASGLAPLNATVALNGDSVALLDAERGVADAERQLNLVLNRPLEAPVLVSRQVAFAEGLDLGRLQADLASAPALRAAELDERLSLLDEQVARSAFWPTLNLDAGYGYTLSDQDASFILINRNLGFNGTVGLSVPLFTGGTRRVQVRAAELGAQRAALAREDVLRTQQAALLDAWTAYGNARRILDLQRVAVRTARENLARSGEGFRAGTVDGTAFREAQRQLLLARNQQAAARFNAKLAEIEVLRLAGRL